MPLKKNQLFPEHVSKPLVIAHRGFSDEAPENSLAAFHKAIDAGADMIELDVRLSADNIPVVFHDKRLQRTSNSGGMLQKKTAAQLQELDNGSWFSPKFSRERIPLLDEVLAFSKRAPLNIEIKPDLVSTNGISAVEIVLAYARKAKVLSRVMFTSFNHIMMKEAKEIEGSITTGIIYNPITHFRKSPSKLLSTAKAEIFVCSKYQMNSDVADDVRDSGFRCFVYAVETGRDVQRMLDLNIDGIICNNPKFVQETLRLLQK
jgi:glycerophosphoryl diester phosphodiesterase